MYVSMRVWYIDVYIEVRLNINEKKVKVGEFED